MKKTIITYTSRKNASKIYTLVSSDESNNTAILTDSNGAEHTMKLTTLRKTFKKSVEEIEVEEPKTKEQSNDTNLNRHQLLAKEKVTAAYNWNIGGLENDVQDGNREDMPPIEEMFDLVLDAVMTEDYGVGYCGPNVRTELRFAGNKFIRQTLADLFREDGYEVPDELLAVPEKKHLVGPRKNIKGDPSVVNDDEVVMRAFTGMVIGVFKIEKETKTTITVKTAKGKLKFDKTTGIQIDSNNKKFANRIEV
nr:MAG TPA: hypothetical protein [Bacteriophage sp.]